MSDDSVENYDDVTMYGLSAESEEALLLKQVECTFIWSNKTGHGVGVTMSYIYRNGSVWLTATKQRARIAALMRDPRASVVISSAGTNIPVSQSVTYKGRVILHEDEETKAWFYPDFAKHIPGPAPDPETFVQFLDTPERVILELIPEKSIKFDGGIMQEKTTEAIEKGNG